MKLELKHLVYQTFKPLRVYFGENNIDLIQSIDYCNGIIGFLNRNEAYLLNQKTFKLILRPMSDLKKGFHKDFDESLFDENNYVFTDEQGIKAKPSIELFIGDGCNNTIIFDGVIEIYNLLMKHHFDYFGLIEKGLAVSVHDVSKADG